MSRPQGPPGPVRTRYLRLRRAVGQTPPGRALKRRVGREARIPALTEPDAAALIPYPAEAELPEALKDGRILLDALAWRSRAFTTPAREHRPLETRPRAAPPSPGRGLANIVVVSHCDFTGNSALHVYAIACELQRRGFSPVVAVPDNAESVEDVGRPAFPILTYAEAVTDALSFPDGRGPDVVHAFTPRELVRELTVALVRRHGCRHLVHLEDDDDVVLSAELGGADVAMLRQLPLPVLDRIIQPRQSHPLRAARFLEQAAGVTVLVDRLLELVPAGVPAAVVRAGFDEAVLTPRRAREEVRAELRLEPEELAVVYTGNIHAVNLEEMRDLYEAIAQLRREGQPVVLVKTGWGSVVAATFKFPTLGAGLRDLGWVPRASVPDILAAADVLVQPGGPNPFNDFRFPSKLPEYLASGRPVVLPRTNVGLELRDGENALLLERGDAPEIAAAIRRLSSDPALRARLGDAGRAFALRELRWAASVDKLELLLGEIAGERLAPAPAWVLGGADPPVKLVALVPDVPDEAEAEHARAHGVYGFCLDASPGLDVPRLLLLGVPFCLRLGASSAERPPAVGASLASRNYIRAGGAPLFLAYEESGLSSAVEDIPVSVTSYEAAMRSRLAAALPERSWFRSVAFPRSRTDDPAYRLWLRKLVLQTAVRAPCQEPLLFLDASHAWAVRSEREAWLAATRSALREGIEQFYASRHVSLSGEESDSIVRMT